MSQKTVALIATVLPQYEYLLLPALNEKHLTMIHCPVLHLTKSSPMSIGITTRYELDAPGIKCRCGRDFPQLSRPALGPTQPPVQWVPGLSRG